MDSPNFDLIIKIVILGEASVGKTNLLLRYSQDSFDESMKPTIGMDFLSKDIELDKTHLKVQFWDTAGQEKYRSLASSYYKVANGAILVYDVSRKETFRRLGAWLEEIKSNTPKELKVMLIGNKSDLIVEREVSTEEGKSFAQERNLFFWETSAKKNSDKNVNTSFEALIKECMKDLMQIERQKQEMDIDQIRKQTIEIKPKHDEKKKDGCC